MSAITSPYGLRVVKCIGDRPFSGGMHSYPLTLNRAQGFFFGDPVGLIAGSPIPLVASPTTTLSANNPIGIMMGCEYQDPVRGFVNAQFLPANAVNNGATKIKLKIADDPMLVMAVQADGPIQLAQIGLNAGLKNFTSGSVATGDSLVQLDSASATPGTAATLAVKIYDFVYKAAPSPGASSTPGDAFTDVLVIWNAGVHRFMVSAGQ